MSVESVDLTTQVSGVATVFTFTTQGASVGNQPFIKIVANALSAGVTNRECFAMDNGGNWRGGVNTAATCATLCFRSNLLGAFQWSDPGIAGGDGNCGCCSNAGSDSNPTGKAGGHPSITYFTQTGQPTAAGISGWVDGSTPTQGVPCVRVGATTCTVTSTSVHSYHPNVVFYSSTAGGTYKRVPGVISGTSTNRDRSHLHQQGVR